MRLGVGLGLAVAGSAAAPTAVTLVDPGTLGAGAAYRAWFRSGTDYWTAGSGTVSSWNDQSGNNLHAANATGGTQPAEVTDDGDGFAGVEFTTSKTLAAAAVSNFIAAAEFTMFIVFKSASMSSGTKNYGHDTYWIDASQYVGLASSSTPIAFGYNYDGTEDYTTSASIALNTRTLICYRHQGGNIYISKNGDAELAAVASGSTQVTTGAMTLGRGQLNATIYDLIFFNSGSLDAGVVSAIKANRLAFYGIT